MSGIVADTRHCRYCSHTLHRVDTGVAQEKEAEQELGTSYLHRQPGSVLLRDFRMYHLFFRHPMLLSMILASLRGMGTNVPCFR